MAKIVHISSAHKRNELRIHLKQCNSLAAFGYDVYFIVADGQGDSKIGDVKILDSGLPQGRFQRLLITPWRLLKRAMEIKGSVYHFHDPELLLIALFLKKNNANVIYDSHEDVPRAIMSRDWISPWIRRLVSIFFEFFENFISRRLTCVIGATPFIAERFDRAGCKSLAINNFPLSSEIRIESTIREWNPSICFLGGISRVRGVREIIIALESLSTRMVLAGPFDDDKTRLFLEQLPGWRNVDYKGNLARKEAVKIMKESMIGMICYLPEPNHINSYPNKLFEYMAAELPVIASNFPLWRKIIEEAACGVCVDPTNPSEIRQAIEQMINDPEGCRQMGKNGKKAVQDKYNWVSEEKKLFQLYSNLIASKNYAENINNRLS